MIIIGIICEVTSTKILPWFLSHGTINNESYFRLLHHRDDYTVDLRAINLFDSLGTVKVESLETE